LARAKFKQHLKEGPGLHFPYLMSRAQEARHHRDLNRLAGIESEGESQLRTLNDRPLSFGPSRRIVSAARGAHFSGLM